MKVWDLQQRMKRQEVLLAQLSIQRLTSHYRWQPGPLLAGRCCARALQSVLEMLTPFNKQKCCHKWSHENRTTGGRHYNVTVWCCWHHVICEWTNCGHCREIKPCVDYVTYGEWRGLNLKPMTTNFQLFIYGLVAFWGAQVAVEVHFLDWSMQKLFLVPIWMRPTRSCLLSTGRGGFFPGKYSPKCSVCLKALHSFLMWPKREESLCQHLDFAFRHVISQTHTDGCWTW